MDKATKEKGNGMVAAILIRGLIGVNTDVRDTLRMLNITVKNSCCVLKDTPTNRGMLQKCKDFITYGELDEETHKLLQEKRSKQGQRHYALHPPRGGFERKGTKVTFTQKGALGYRGEKINDLIKKMI